VPAAAAPSKGWRGSPDLTSPSPPCHTTLSSTPPTEPACMTSTVLSPASPPAAFYAPAHRQPAPGARPSPKPPAPHRLQQQQQRAAYHPPAATERAPPSSTQASKPASVQALPVPVKEEPTAATVEKGQQRSAPPPPPALPATEPAGQLPKDEEMRRRQLVKDYEGLSELCSQHHRSEYNRLKWGPAGASHPYPFSDRALGTAR